jgi:hypothetical protein
MEFKNTTFLLSNTYMLKQIIITGCLIFLSNGWHSMTMNMINSFSLKLMTETRKLN